MNICGVEIPIFSGPIGLSLSGGTDSSLLLYILLKNKTENLHVFSLAKDTNFRISAFVTANIIEKCIRLTKNNSIIHHVSYNLEQDNKILFKYSDDFLKNKVINYCYTGVTANPPKEIADSFTIPEDNTLQKIRDPTVSRSIYHPIFNGYVMPFTNIDKKKVFEIYKELNILDTLFPYTFSCEVENIPDNKVHCGKCWWCKERQWGFNLL